MKPWFNASATRQVCRKRLREDTRRKRRLPAYMTAEASFLVPLLIVVFLSLFYLTGYVESASVLTSVTCASAVTGREQDTGPLLFTSAKETAIEENDRGRTAKTTFSVVSTSLFPLSETTVSAYREDPDPVSIIRKARYIADGSSL